jgi:hypothetical protein
MTDVFKSDVSASSLMMSHIDPPLPTSGVSIHLWTETHELTCPS